MCGNNMTVLTLKESSWKTQRWYPTGAAVDSQLEKMWVVWKFKCWRVKYAPIETKCWNPFHFRCFVAILSWGTSQNTLPRCSNEDFSRQAVIFEVVLSIVVTCVCVINNLDGSLSQIYYSVHFKWSQVLLIQSDVSQKGNWNRQTEMTHVRRLEVNSIIWSISLSRPVASSVSCHSDWVGCMEAQSKSCGRPRACNTHI